MNFTHSKKVALYFSLLIGLHQSAFAQQVFDRKESSVGNVGLSITNVGTVGNPQNVSRRSGTPSFQFPLNSGQEHLFEGGIWIGAIYGGGQLQVSTSAVTSSGGFTTGASGFEFTNDGTPIFERSSLTTSEQYSPNAISHQDLIAKFSDRRTSINTGSSTIPIFGHEQPLFSDIELTSYNWNFGFTENFSILKWKISNTSDVDWDSVYVGFYVNLINRNVNSTIETGSAFFNKLGVGFIDTLETIYVFDAGSTDDPSLNTYAGLTILGSDFKGRNFHPDNADELTAANERVPRVNPAYWLFSSGSGVFQRPNDDVERYGKMARFFNMDSTINDPQNGNITIRRKLAIDGRTSVGNYISFVSIGPFRKIAAGESIDVYTAYVAGLMPNDLQDVTNYNIQDNAYSKSLFVENVERAYRTFEGEDRNKNGVLDAGEDINGNGVLDRFLIPEPPSTPKIRVELESGKAVVYWDNAAESSVDPVSGIQDFEGYKIYRSKLGDDLKGTIATNAKVIREFDKDGNSYGNNNGFDEVLLNTPVTFDDEPGVEYWYRYEVGDLLNGWQYLFSVTAFDASFEGENVESLETSPNANSVRVFPGTPVNVDFTEKVGVYPNPYRVNAAWDGGNEFNRKIMFYNLPSKAEIRVYTLSGDVVAQLNHDSETYTGDSRWFNDFSASNRKMSGGEYAWNLQTEARQNLTTGLYFFTVKDLNSGKIQRGKFVIIK
ncbi:hypothetical protein EP331_12795 [bacterium]|nr:MAG: hypothetical protein EP331_12795 [bacterium]